MTESNLPSPVKLVIPLLIKTDVNFLRYCSALISVSISANLVKFRIASDKSLYNSEGALKISSL